MKYVSLFSGIEAASVAWEPLGFEPVAFSEVDPFCNQVLAARFPHVPNLGDIKQVDWRPYHGDIDIVVGGSPCQAFSVAGKRAGLLDERGALMLEYVRAVREIKPTWCLWENVPGVLSQDGGRAFATLQGELEDCGYTLAWRVLDAQFFGVAQRRRRVFLVGHARAECAAAVLFEPKSLLGNSTTSRKARERLTATAQTGVRKAISNAPPVGIEQSLPSSPSAVLDLYDSHGIDARVRGPVPVCPSITAYYGTGGNNTPLIHRRIGAFTSYALVGNTIDRQPQNGGNGTGYSKEVCYTLTAMDRHAVCTVEEEPIIMSSGQSFAQIDQGICSTQTARQYKDPPILFSQPFCDPENIACMASGHSRAEIGFNLGTCLTAHASIEAPLIGDGLSVRRLMPIECERLQGFPDNWTLVEWNGKPLAECPDARRYKALGNSMAVPVMRWIGQGIQMVDELSGVSNKPLQVNKSSAPVPDA